MPTLLKTKEIRATGDTLRTPPKSGSARKSLKNGELDVAGIDEITNRIGEQLKAQLSGPAVGEGRRVFGFNVIVDRGRVRLDSRLHEKKAAISKKEEAEFDPSEAGRKLVLRMQEAEGGAWTGQELMEKFNLTPAALHKRRKEYRIVSWRDAKHQFHYPQWQFTPAGALLTGIQNVLQAFRSLDEWRIMRYFLAPRHDLDGGTALELLRAGEVDSVVVHAKAHAEENSW
ncbi:MAG: hypothetical protein JWL59_3462 [Chthoniobacteraceae bacterium]|nr:hypothetical protein [Chthoniobacteraceae bacterium]